MKDTAEKLAAKGWAVFPVKGKQPLVKWPQYQMGDLDAEGRDPWQWATGIGVDCGRSSLVVIDVDDPGAQARLEDATGATLDSYGTLQSRTGKGSHYVFAAHGDPVTNARGAIPAGIDVRGAGGYIIVPPSVHPDGGTYQWAHRAAPAPFPEPLRELCSATTSRPTPEPVATTQVGDPWAQRAMEDEAGLVRGALEGNRNQQLFRSALKLYSIVNGGRLTAEQVRAALTGAAQLNTNGPRIETEEVDRTLDSARERAVEVREPASRHVAPTSLPAVDAQDGFGVLSVDDLNDLPEPKWLLKERVPEGQTWVYGAPGVGKTFVTLDWAASIAASGKTVMAFIGEGVSGYARRVAAWRAAYPEASLRNFLAVPQAPHLLDNQSVELLVATIRDRRPDLIVVDTWARALVGGDENSAQDTGRAIDVLDRLYRTYGTSSLVVHHSQKHGQMERGSGAIRGAADATWEVRTYQGHGEYDSMEVACQKMKDAEPPPPWLVQLRQEGDSAVVYPSAWGA